MFEIEKNVEENEKSRNLYPIRLSRYHCYELLNDGGVVEGTRKYATGNQPLYKFWKIRVAPKKKGTLHADTLWYVVV